MTASTTARIANILDERICIAAATAAATAGYEGARQADVDAVVAAATTSCTIAGQADVAASLAGVAVDVKWYRHEGRRAARLTLKAYGFEGTELERVLAAVYAAVPQFTTGV